MSRAGTAGGWRRWLPASPADWTMAVFGALALLLGLLGLVWPEGLLAALGFEWIGPAGRAPGDHTRVFVAASSVASFNLGVYYLVAVATRWRPFYRFTVAFRLLTWAVFTALVAADVAPVEFLGVALWEGAGAVATGFCLVYEARSGRGRVLDSDRRGLGVVSNP